MNSIYINGASFRKVEYCGMLSDKPRFADNHETERYIWAMKTRNVTCSALSEPAPTFEWQRNGQRLGTNDTFRIFTSGRVSKLQVRTLRPLQQPFIELELVSSSAASHTGAKPLHLERSPCL